MQSLPFPKTLVTNENSLAKLIINILNSMSFFLDICILDLFPYVRQLINLANLCYESLLCFRLYVRSNLSA